MGQKIALSASYWDHPKVQAVLNECDLIYTTNVRARDQLWQLFGESKVKFIPDSTEGTYRYLKAKHDFDAEFIGFNDLLKLRFEAEG